MTRPGRMLWLAASLLLVVGTVLLTIVVGSTMRVGAASDFVLVSPTSLTVSEPDGQGTFTITLSIEPTATVTVGLTVTSTECTVDPGSLLLTADNWATGVAARVTAQDDTIVDGPQLCGIETATAVSADPTFDGEDPDDILATVLDDDHTLDLTIIGDGDVSLNPDQPTYTYGTVVTLTATADPGWSLDSWSGDLSGFDNPATVTILGNTAITATFTQDQYTLDLTIVGDGEVSLNPDQPTYTYGTVVTLTATANPGWSFDAWSGDLSGSDNPATVTILGNTAITATFTQDQYTLDLTIVGDGDVSLNPDQPTYTYGTVVTLTATADPGWSFDSWSGDLSGSDNPATVTILGNTAITATFTQDHYYVTVTADGMGTVDNSPGNPYTYGQTATLTPVPDPGWSFDSWTGPDALYLIDNEDGTWSLWMDGNKDVTAVFTQDEYTLTVNVNGNGSVTVDPVSTTYHYGDEVTLTAVADPGWTFDSWSGDASGSDNPTALTIVGNTSVTANITQDEYTLTVIVNGDGSVTIDPDTPLYRYGDVATLTAIADPGWTFDSWSGGLVGSENPSTVTILGDTSITANITQDEYSLTTSVDGNGIVAVDPEQPTYHYGDHVTFTAVADPGWTFESWSGDLSGSDNPVGLTILGNTSVTASITQDDYQLVLYVQGNGQVSQEPDQPTYHYGDMVMLTVIADPGWTFSAWSGDLVAHTNPATITMNSTSAATATITQDEYELDVDILGSGSVLKEPDTATYHYGDQVTLTAIANPGWTFVGWSGGLSGQTNPATVAVPCDMLIVAIFTQDDYTLTTNSIGNGSVSREPNQITYQYGDEVVLTAVPDSGWGFAGWSGALTGITNPAILIMDGHKTVTALFEWQHDLIVELLGTGSVVLDPPGGVYSHDTVVQITAIPDPGWIFSGWSGDLAGTDNPASVTLDRDKTITASFTYLVHLPLILNRWPPIPEVPSLNAIDNGDGDGSYTIDWSTSAEAETYLLQEATNSDFSDPVTAYTGPSTSHTVSGQGAARYYYRVKARNTWMESDWSIIRQADVLWEAEPNDDAYEQANGPIVPSLVYYGTFPNEDDLNDYYFLDLYAAHRLKLWLKDIPNGQNYDLVLRDEGLAVVGYSAQSANAGEYIDTVQELPPGRYYIQVYHYSGGGSTQPYQLTYTIE